MLDNNSLIKYFVRVPEKVSFNGAEVSNATGNQKKIYFDENTNQIWVRGHAFSLDQDSRSALNTLIGSDTNMSVRAIAQDVVANIASWQGADANEVIDTLKEVLTWFNNLPEGDEGAVALVGRVGKPATYYTATDEEVIGGTKQVGDVKTPATGLYKEIADSVAAKNVTASAAQDELLVSASASDNNVVVSSTSKLQNAVTAAEASIQGITVAGTSLTVTGNANAKTAEITKADLQHALFDNTYESSPLTYSYLGVTVSLKESNGELTYLNVDPTELANRVSAVEEFDPWEEYSAS